MKKGRGLFIVLDGPEGCGKSTQSGALHRSFLEAGYDVLRTFQPGGTELGARIRQELLHGSTELTAGQEAIYFTCDRALHIVEVVKPALDSDKVVVCDRYASATWAYQGYAGRLGTDIVERLTDLAVGDVVPDLVIVLDIDPVKGFGRKQGTALDRIERKPTEFHYEVRDGFLDYAVNHGCCEVINADQEPLAVHSEIIRAARDWLGVKITSVLEV